VTYTFADGTVSGLNNGWTKSPPAHNGNPLWFTVATALSAGATDTIASTEWETAAIMAQDGADGSGGGATPITSIGNTSNSTSDVTNTAFAQFAVSAGDTVPAWYDGVLNYVSGTGVVSVTTYLEISINGGAFTSIGSATSSVSSSTGTSADPYIDTSWTNTTGAKAIVQVRVRTSRSGGAGVTFNLSGNLQFG